MEIQKMKIGKMLIYIQTKKMRGTVSQLLPATTKKLT